MDCLYTGVHHIIPAERNKQLQTDGHFKYLVNRKNKHMYTNVFLGYGIVKSVPKLSKTESRKINPAERKDISNTKGSIVFDKSIYLWPLQSLFQISIQSDHQFRSYTAIFPIYTFTFWLKKIVQKRKNIYVYKNFIHCSKNCIIPRHYHWKWL